MTTTIIQITDNSLDEQIAALCRRILVREAQGQPIICVSQKPVDWQGQAINLIVGEIGRSWLSLYKQLLAGIAHAPTDWIAVAEHDVLYTHEHLGHQPTDASVFHYNLNCWLVEWQGNHPELNGMYSFWVNKDRSPRLALSQLICHKAILRECIEERLAILEGGADWDKQFLGCGEPGVVSSRALDKARRYAASGQPVYLAPYLNEYLTKWRHATFETQAPNLDIRHGSNWTGPKRGKKRTYDLPPWGRFVDLIGQA